VKRGEGEQLTIRSLRGGGRTVPTDITVPTDSTVFQLLNATLWSQPNSDVECSK
jgi:hypothetical protein